MDRTGPRPGLALRRLEQAQRKWRTLILATTRKVQRRVEGAGRGEQLRQEGVVAGLASMLAAQRELSMCGNKVAIATEGYGSTYTYVVDIGPDPATGKRRQRTKGGFRTRKECLQTLNDVIAAARAGTFVEPAKRTVESFWWRSGCQP